MLRSLLLLCCLSLPVLAQEKAITRIGFGSCADQNKPCPIWDTIVEAKPELMLLLGDTMYADIENSRLKPSTPEKIAQCYEEVNKLEAFQKLRAKSKLIGTWDDHDYGNNDAGVEWEHKDAAQKLFHDFFETPADSPLRNRKGVYSSQIFGPEGKRVQVIMLDTRYHRSPLKKDTKPLPGTRIIPYIPVTDADATMLGEEQWKWLTEELKKPAELRIIGSSIQLISKDHPFEKWDNIPAERAKFLQVVRDSGASGVVIVSGDRHLGEISLETDSVGYPLYDLTSSGFNQASKTWRKLEENRNRVCGMPYGQNFGMIEIDWDTGDLKLQLRHEDGEVAMQQRVNLKQLQGSGEPAAPRPEGVLSAAEALTKVGSEVTVQFMVQAGRTFPGTRILLNSEKDFRSERNFTVVLNAKGMTGDWEKATFETFEGKTIRAKGKVTEFRNAPQIQIDDAKLLEIVKE